MSYDIDEAAQKLRIDFRPGADVDEMRGRVDQLLRRYSNPEFGLKSVVALDQRRELPTIDAWAGMLERRWATLVGEGHVILRDSRFSHRRSSRKRSTAATISRRSLNTWTSWRI